jgi:predicted Zn finger-like uncharacterized protein
MIINCICGKKKFRLADELMPPEGSKVRCGSCSEVWFYHPNQGNPTQFEETSIPEDDLVDPTDYQAPPKNDIVKEKSKTATQEDQVSNETPEDSLPDVDGEELLDKDLFKDQDIDEKPSTSFKIFSDDDSELPSKEEMDKNLDNFKIERDKNLNFFQRLFKKDRMKDAKNALEKKNREEKYEEINEKNIGRRTRFLFYLLILLSLVFSVMIVPMKNEIVTIFPFMEAYLDFLFPVYENIKHKLKF